MAMTKKFKVSFDVTAKMPSDVQAILEKDMLHLCKQVGSGAIVPDGKQKEMIVQFLTHGMEGVMAFVVRTSFREAIKDNRTKSIPIRTASSYLLQLYGRCSDV